MASPKALILVIDDEEIVRELTQSILQFFGYASLVAENGENGVALFDSHKDEIDAVLCDMVMPSLNGEEVFRAIRAISPNAQVLLSSGLEDPELIDRLESQGLAGFLIKPYKPTQLIEKLKTLLAKPS